MECGRLSSATPTADRRHGEMQSGYQLEWCQNRVGELLTGSSRRGKLSGLIHNSDNSKATMRSWSARRISTDNAFRFNHNNEVNHDARDAYTHESSLQQHY